MSMDDGDPWAAYDEIKALKARVADLELKQHKLDLWVEEVSVKLEKVIELQRRIASLIGINVRV